MLNSRKYLWFVSAFVLAGANLFAQVGVTDSTKNPNQVAILHWYGANLTTRFSVATPSAIAFDGANMWIANLNDNTVTKLRASDGALMGTFSVGRRPDGLAYDGANMWVANRDDSTVAKLRASDGAVVATFPVGAAPAGLVFDGFNIWVANAADGTLTKLRASDGAPHGTFKLPLT